MEYNNIYLDIDHTDHHTEYMYPIAINEGGTSVDVSDLPSNTPSICKSVYYYLASIEAVKDNSTTTYSACNK